MNYDIFLLMSCCNCKGLFFVELFINAFFVVLLLLQGSVLPEKEV